MFDGNYTIAVNKGVKTTAGVEVPADSFLLYVKDTTGPTLVSGNASAKTSTDTITLKFSEPVSHLGAVAYIDGNPAQLQATSNPYELKVVNSTAISAGKTVEVTVLNVKDIAGNVLTTNPSKTSVTIVADTAAPAVSSVTVTGEKSFDVTFTKSMAQSSFLNNVAVVTGGLNPASTAFTVSKISADGKTVSFTTAAPVYASSNTFSGTLIIGKDVLDVAGNKLGADYSQNISFTVDTAAPTVTSVTTNADKDQLIVAFNENVTLVGTSAATLAGLTLIDANGAVVSLDAAAVASTNENKLVIDNNNVAFAAGNYTLRLAAGLVHDGQTKQNQNAATVQALTVSATASAADKNAPVVTVSATPVIGGYNGAATAPAAEQTISYTVQDSVSGIDINTVLNLANYTVDGKALPQGTYITTTGYSSTNTKDLVTVTLHMPSSSISKSTTASQLVISNLRDLSGNVITPAVSGGFALAEGVAPELASVAIATGDNTTLVAAFTEDVTGVALTNFNVLVNGDDVTTAATLTPVTVGPDKGKYYFQVAQAYDATADVVFIDLGTVDGTYNSAEDVVLATGVTTAPSSTVVDFSSSSVSTLKVELDTVGTIKDAQGNAVKTGSKTVK